MKRGSNFLGELGLVVPWPRNQSLPIVCDYMRAYVLLTLDKPFVKALYRRLLSWGIVEVHVKIERMHIFCHVCGFMGHRMLACRNYEGSFLLNKRMS